MRSYLLFYSFCLAILAFSQDPIERYYPFPGALGSQGGISDNDGGLIHVASHEGDITVMRTSSDGEVLWANTYPFFTEEGLYGPGLVTTSEGIFVVGFTMGAGTQARDGLLLHLDMDGALLATKRYDVAGGSNAFHSVNPTSNGFIIAGRSQPGTTSYDMLITAFDASGEMLWSRSYGSNEWDWGYEAIQLADGGYALVGYGDGLAAQTRAYVVRTNAAGDELWARSIGNGPADEGYTIAEDAAGDLYVGGRTLGMGVPSPHVSGFITKLNSSGAHQWTRVLPNSIEVADLQITSGKIAWIARPQFIPGAPGNYDIAWGEIDPDGNAIHTNIYGRAANDNVMSMVPKSGGGWYLMGSTNSHSQGHAFFTMEIDAAGTAGCVGDEWDIEWQVFSADVLPFTSVYAEGATGNDLQFGTVDAGLVAVNPCCALTASFTAEQSTSDPYTWTFTNTSIGDGTYTWDLGDGTTSTETSVTHTFDGNGSMVICLTMTGDCGTSESCSTIDISVGLNELQQISLNAYPVPADQQIFLSGNSAPISAITAIDVHGRRIMIPHSSQHGNVTVLNVESLAAGFYTVELHLVSGQKANVRITVAH